jgi:hypothetical protein
MSDLIGKIDSPVSVVGVIAPELKIEGIIANGIKGEQGIQGIQGEPGSAVFKGDTGATGPQGTTGDQGIAGIKGDTGATGTNGTDGIQGIQGEIGFTGAVGSTGLTGDAGIQGIQGIQGETGLPGSAVYKGDTGAAGYTPVKGVDYIDGATGATGAKGDTGDTGATGIQGIQGIQGDIGLTGGQGSTGIQGIKGDTGDQGIQGEVGPQGGIDPTLATQITTLEGAGWTNQTIKGNTDNLTTHQADVVKHVTGAERTAWNAKQVALGFTAENVANKNVANGYAGLGSDGKVVIGQLPSSAWERIAYATLASDTCQIDLVIPTGYKLLIVKAWGLLASAASNLLYMRFNSDSGANYLSGSTTLANQLKPFSGSLASSGGVSVFLDLVTSNIASEVKEGYAIGKAVSITPMTFANQWSNKTDEINLISLMLSLGNNFLAGAHVLVLGVR